MRASTILLALSYFGLGLGLGLGLPQAVDDISIDSASGQTGYCGQATFIDQTTGGSPSVSDCQALRQKILDAHEAYAFAGYGNGHYVPFDSYGSCVIGFSCRGPYGVYWCYVDSLDASDLITSSIDKFSRDGLVGTKGQMPCHAEDGADRTTYWGLYHT